MARSPLVSPLSRNQRNLAIATHYTPQTRLFPPPPPDQALPRPACHPRFSQPSHQGGHSIDAINEHAKQQQRQTSSSSRMPCAPNRSGNGMSTTTADQGRDPEHAEASASHDTRQTACASRQLRADHLRRLGQRTARVARKASERQSTCAPDTARWLRSRRDKRGSGWL